MHFFFPSMLEALKQSRYQMKRCFARYAVKGKRLMKNQQLMEELEKSIDDKVEKARLMVGFLGYIICSIQVVYILDQVRALEEEMLLRIKQQGHTTAQILVVTRLIPDAKGTKCNQELEQISDTMHFQHPSCAIQDRERSCSEELVISFGYLPQS